MSLSTEVLAVLKNWELTADKGTTLRDKPRVVDVTIHDIYDDDGERLFSITSEITEHDMASLLFYIDARYKQGQLRGRRDLQASLRNLLDVPRMP